MSKSDHKLYNNSEEHEADYVLDKYNKAKSEYNKSIFKTLVEIEKANLSKNVLDRKDIDKVAQDNLGIFEDKKSKKNNF